MNTLKEIIESFKDKRNSLIVKAGKSPWYDRPKMMEAINKITKFITSNEERLKNEKDKSILHRKTDS